MLESGKAINKEQQPQQIQLKKAADLTLMEAMCEYDKVLKLLLEKDAQIVEIAKINQEQLMKINTQAEEIKKLKEPPKEGTE